MYSFKRTACRLFSLVVVCGLLAGCASRAAVRADLADARRAAELVGQGCYDCLLDAREIYERLFERRGQDATLASLFEVQLLVVLREKELAIDEAAALDRARALAARLPASVAARRYLEIVEAVPPDASGTPVRERQAPPSGAVLRAPFVEESVAWLRQGTLLQGLRDYLVVSLQCAAPGPPPRPAATEREQAPPSGLPLLMYRGAFCRNRIDVPALEQLRSDVPRFAEAALFQARGGLGALLGGDGVRLRALLTEAYARFPQAPAVTHQLGTAMQAFSDYRAAARYHTETLALRERHEEARLGRAVAFSYLGQSDEAIADATVLIDEAAPLYGDAYFWRAWNRHRRQELELARADIDRAKSLRYASHVLTLAGMIEHDQDDLEIARTDLTAAVSIDPSNCSARWYLGAVEVKDTHWLRGAVAFAGAMQCYDQAAVRSEQQREVMARRDDLDPDFRARQIAGFDAAIRDDRSQESAAALNAAINYARSGERTTAATFLERAAIDTARREVVDQVRKALAATP